MATADMTTLPKRRAAILVLLLLGFCVSAITNASMIRVGSTAVTTRRRFGSACLL
jgi:hypothetical protein